jgi:outer membrane protein assembly factor BamB
MRSAILTAGCVMLLGAPAVRAQDWPQWRGPNRDAKAAGLKAPATWPKDLTKKWKAPVGEGAATPALVGDRLYVFARAGGDEVLRCLDAATGRELWQDKYASQDAAGAAARGPHGPRSSPAVADGKVVTLGVRDVLSCYDAATGKLLWRKDDLKGFWPSFFVASSPVLVDGLCVAQLGGTENGQRNGKNGGGVVAYDLAGGAEKWRWTGDTPAYASPSVMTVGGTRLIVAETKGKIVALTAADGKLAWETPFATRYNASSPVVDGETIIYLGDRGAAAVKLEKKGDGFAGRELWSTRDTTVMYNTPVLKDGRLYGVNQRGQFFCMDAATGKALWPAAAPASGGGDRGGGRGGRGRGGRGGGMGGGGYGSVVDAGSVLLALTPAAELVVFEPSDKELKKVASYKVANGGTYAYPVVSGNRVFIKDNDSVTLWTIE